MSRIYTFGFGNDNIIIKVVASSLTEALSYLLEDIPESDAVSNLTKDLLEGRISPGKFSENMSRTSYEKIVPGIYTLNIGNDQYLSEKYTNKTVYIKRNIVLKALHEVTGVKYSKEQVEQQDKAHQLFNAHCINESMTREELYLMASRYGVKIRGAYKEQICAELRDYFFAEGY